MTDAESPAPAPPRDDLESLVGAILAVAAVVVGFYGHFNTIYPVAAGALIFLVCWKCGLIRDKLLLEAISVQGGQVAWMLLAIIFGLANALFDIEVSIYVLAILLVAFRPRRWTAAVLLLYQCIGLIANVLNLWFVPIATEMSRALAVHAGFRIAAIVLLIMLLRRGFFAMSAEKISAVFE